ncbi:MAG: SRPBCC family protein [Actinomycetota bacterium]
MERRIEHVTSAGADRVRSVVRDLTTYPSWLSIVSRVEPAPTPSDEGPAWFVTLRARFGRFSRAKRLRMVRTRDDGDLVVFERRELDGRRHSRWHMTAHVEELEVGTSMVIVLRYDGGLLEPVVARLLDREVEESRPRLEALLVEA